MKPVRFEIYVHGKFRRGDDCHARNLARMLWTACPGSFMDIFSAHLAKLQAHADPREYE